MSDKERELGEAQTEIRALRLSERAREKAVEEVIPNCFLVQSIGRATMCGKYSLQSLEREGEKCPKKKLVERKRKNRLLLFYGCLFPSCCISK